MQTIESYKTTIAAMDDLNLIHEFKNVDRQIERLADRREVLSILLQKWDLAETEILARMAK